MPTLDYVSQTPQSVSVTYTDMPAAADLVFVNQVSRAQTPAQSGALAARAMARSDSDSGPGEGPVLLALTSFR